MFFLHKFLQMKDRPRSQLNIHTDHRAAGAEFVLSVFIWGVWDFTNTNAVMEMELEKSKPN